VPCSLALINHACGDKTAVWVRAIGVWTGAGGLGLAAGPVISGLLLSAMGWRRIFLVNLPLAGLGIWMVWRFAVETGRPAVRRGIDPVGQVLAAVALMGLVWSVIEAGWFPGLVVAARFGARVPIAGGLLLAGIGFLILAG
jgi:DHA2 family methylenomycin A resistance protein-like MFS transporter